MRVRPVGISIQLNIKASSWPESSEDDWRTAWDLGVTFSAYDESGDDRKADGFGSYDAAGMVVDRGSTADYVVKADDRLLRCIDADFGGETEAHYKTTSDGLRRLFRENTWEAIKAMHGFDDGGEEGCNGPGNAAYDRWVYY